MNIESEVEQDIWVVVVFGCCLSVTLSSGAALIYTNRSAAFLQTETFGEEILNRREFFPILWVASSPPLRQEIKLKNLFH